MMTEREKMLAGMAYQSRDTELISLYAESKRLMKVYNQIEATDGSAKRELLQAWLGKVGDGVWIEQPFFCEFGKHIFIGQGTYINMNCVFLDNNTITIGENCLIAPSVQIYTASHPLKASERIVRSAEGRSSYLTSAQPVSIGDNVWIGGGTIIFPNVRIGSHVTIGAGSIVTKDIPDHVLAMGNPCRVYKSLLDEPPLS